MQKEKEKDHSPMYKLQLSPLPILLGEVYIWGICCRGNPTATSLFAKNIIMKGLILDPLL